MQVKRSALPLGVSLAAWRRMEAEGARLGWRWVIATVGADGTPHFLDPAVARVQKAARLDAAAEIRNLPAWGDGTP